ncbi:MAG: hypothetical protein ACT452_09400 [Microthrixaceae bacterium]
MKISEKSLELNVGAELLALLRNVWGMPKAYLRGLTQQEEKQEGVDFFVQLDPDTRIFAFLFKAPKGAVDGPPFRYTLRRVQHDLLFDLAQFVPGSVFYVFPYYVTAAKLHRDVPDLIKDTWVLELEQMPTAAVFGDAATKTIRCDGGVAKVNPEYTMRPLREMQPPRVFPYGHSYLGTGATESCRVIWKTDGHGEGTRGSLGASALRSFSPRRSADLQTDPRLRIMLRVDIASAGNSVDDGIGSVVNPGVHGMVRHQ